MPTPSHEPASKGVKQQSSVTSEERAPKNKNAQPEAPAKQQAKQDKDRSDWEGMTPKPEQGDDDIAAPGQLPETD